MTLSAALKSKETRPFERSEEKQQQIFHELSEIDTKTPGEAHESIVAVLYKQQELIQRLTEDNKELRSYIQQQLSSQHGTTENIMRRIWDNKEDEFWDTL